MESGSNYLKQVTEQAEALYKIIDHYLDDNHAKKLLLDAARLLEAKNAGEEEIARLKLLAIEAEKSALKHMEAGIEALDGNEEAFIEKVRMFRGLSVAPQVLAVADIVVDYKEAMQLIEPYQLAPEVQRDYAVVYTQSKFMQNMAGNLDSTLGYESFKNWADEHQISFDVQSVLDPTNVSKALQQNFSLTM